MAFSVAMLLLIIVVFGPSALAVRVKCDRNFFCETTSPVCCGPSEGSRDYCSRGGLFCCDHTNGEMKLGCPIGTTCCIPPSRNTRSCCTAGTTCVEGTCVDDACAHIKNQSQCLTAPWKCGWCCDSGQCQDLATLSRSCKQGTTVRTQPSSPACPDPCTEHTTCETCSASRCSWCCSQSRCGSPGRTGCNPLSVLLPDASCAKCRSGVTIEEDVDWLNQNFYLPWAILIGLGACAALLLLTAIRLVRLINRRRFGAGHHGAIIELDRVEGDTLLDVDAATTTLYGFAGNEVLGEIPFPVPTEWPPTADLSQCSVCMEAYATVFSSPCGHIAMCESCTRLVQERHIIQLEAKFRSGAAIEVTPPPCILCRRPVVGNVLLTRFLGPHPLFGQCPLPGSRRHSQSGEVDLPSPVFLSLPEEQKGENLPPSAIL